MTLERILARAETPSAREDSSRLNVDVVYTSDAETVAALKRAGTLADRLGARITLVVPQVVPFPLPLTKPPVRLDFSARHFRAIARQSPVETAVVIYLCRDATETLVRVLTPQSLVVIGGRKRWWPTREKRLAQRLRSAGHEVILNEME